MIIIIWLVTESPATKPISKSLFFRSDASRYRSNVRKKKVMEYTSADVDWRHTMREHEKMTAPVRERKTLLVFLRRNRKRKKDAREEKRAESIFTLNAIVFIGASVIILPRSV